MDRNHIVRVLGLCLGGAGVAVATHKWSTKAGGSGLSPRDYLEISQLYGLYARDVDPGSPRNASWLFTDDGEFTADPGCTFRGKRDLATFYEQVRQRHFNGTRHFNTSCVIVKTPTGATASGYMLAVGRDDPTDPWTIEGSGVYEDQLAKTDAGWRFKRRLFHQDSYKNDLTPFRRSPIG